MLEPQERDALRAQLRSAAASTAEPKDLLSAVERLYRQGKPSDALLCARAVNELAPALVAAGHRELKTFVARSVSLEPVLPSIQIESALDGFVLRAELGGYGSFLDELLNPGGPLGAGSSYDLVVVALDLEDIAGRLPDLCASGRGDGVAEEISACVDRVRSMLESVRGRVASRIVLQGFVVPDRTALGDVGEANLPGGLHAAVRELNRQLAAMSATIAGCVFFAVEDVAARFGKAAWADERMFLSSRVPMHASAFPAYARGLVRSVQALFRPMRKVLCTDLDQTFWGGILGEEGPEGIATGTAFPGNCYRAYQVYLRRLRARGVLLAVVSKNNPGDVDEAFALRKSDLALTLEDFSARKVGWGDKVESLRQIAAELSLGTDALVFVDDNPTECEAVRQAMPEVAVVQVPPEEPWRFVELVQDGGFFETAAISEDDLKRAAEYQSQAERETLRQSFGNRDEFLQSLDIVCTAISASEAPLARAVQLLGKTNQFNVTTRRHGAAEVERFEQTPGGQAMALRVRDRFGDSGVVGLLLAQTEAAVCRIDTLLLSCRVIGRDIEKAMVALAARRAQTDGARGLLGEFRPTKKNGLAAEFYLSCGFRAGLPDGMSAPASITAVGDETSQWYWYDFEQGLPPVPEFLTVEGAVR